MVQAVLHWVVCPLESSHRWARRRVAIAQAQTLQADHLSLQREHADGSPRSSLLLKRALMTALDSHRSHHWWHTVRLHWWAGGQWPYSQKGASYSCQNPRQLSVFEVHYGKSKEELALWQLQTTAALIVPVTPAITTGSLMAISDVSRKSLISRTGWGTSIPRAVHMCLNSSTFNSPMMVLPQPLSMTP